MQTLSPFIHADPVGRLPAVHELSNDIGLTESTYDWIAQQRQEIANIIDGKDNRLLVIIGPCSIHNVDAGLEYADRLVELQAQYRDELFIVMRTYFEKPRTRTGWKGLIVDPHLNGSHDINDGLRTARQFLVDVISKGIPTATEFLDPQLYPYISDLICWGAIGARTTESQIHRQMASGLGCPIGFKNGTDGNIDIAIDAIHAARAQHLLCVPDRDNHQQAVMTKGNENCHIILRGGKGPNYSEKHVSDVAEKLKQQQLDTRLIVDCSHGNSGKIAKNQLTVARDVAGQLRRRHKHIAGVMAESFIVGGNQKLGSESLVYGQSVTDECLGWVDSRELLDIFATAVRSVIQGELETA